MIYVHLLLMKPMAVADCHQCDKIHFHDWPAALDINIR